jgi:propionate CoA-transferase
VNTPDEAELLAGFLNRRLYELGRRVNLIVNYDNFELGRPAAPRFFEMVREHERRYFLSSTRYSTGAFLRRKLGRAFAEARLSQQHDRRGVGWGRQGTLSERFERVGAFV